MLFWANRRKYLQPIILYYSLSGVTHLRYRHMTERFSFVEMIVPNPVIKLHTIFSVGPYFTDFWLIEKAIKILTKLPKWSYFLAINKFLGVIYSSKLSCIELECPSKCQDFLSEFVGHLTDIGWITCHNTIDSMQNRKLGDNVSH